MYTMLTNHDSTKVWCMHLWETAFELSASCVRIVVMHSFLLCMHLRVTTFQLSAPYARIIMKCKSSVLCIQIGETTFELRAPFARFIDVLNSSEHAVPGDYL